MLQTRSCVLIFLANVMVKGAAASPIRLQRRVEYYSSPPPGAIIARPFSLYGGPPFLNFYGSEDEGPPLGPPGPPWSRRRPPQPRPAPSDEYMGPMFSDTAPNEVEWDTEMGGWEALLAASQVNAALSTMTRGAEPEVAQSRPAPTYARRPPRRPAPDYEAESVDGLPLGERDVRPAHISSYSVPHYSVTSDSGRGSGGSGGGGHTQKMTTTSPTSGGSTGGGESKLKAIAIWTHRSRGAAYTLNKDGSLTPERSHAH